MKKLKLLGLLSAAALLLGGCKKSDDSPYILFWGEDSKWIETTENIPVTLNETFVLRSEIGYEDTPKYEWRVDDGEFTQYSSLDGLNITTLGSHNGLSIQKATWTLDFSDERLESGSKVAVRLSSAGDDLTRTLVFEVK